MRVLRKVRENRVVNSFFRKALKKSSEISVKFHNYFISRWSTSGIIDCNFGKYKFKYFNKCDDWLAHYFYYGLPYHEKADLNLFIELSKKSETIVDIGANTVLFSVLASKANSRSKIYSIEPYSANADRMKINLSLNSAQNVSVHEFAIGEYDGEILIAIPKNGSVTDVSSVNVEFSKSVYPDIQWDYVLVKVKTLDNFAGESKIHINLIKCDVESFEMSVFKGADKTLSQDKPTILFECFLDEERKLFFNDILVKYNYYVYLILEQGVVYIKEGFISSSYGLNYLVTPVKPTRTFISYLDTEELWKELLLNPTESLL